ncbi:MAG: elongation factor G [Planctomycetota bacterium]
MATVANASQGLTASGVRNAKDIRNIAIAGHASTGKTLLSERLLLESGEIGRMGAVEDGTTTSDWTEEEKHHQHSMRSSVLHLEHEGHWVNFIDTPGRSDFLGHAIAAFPAVETVAITVDATKGVQSTTRRLMKIAADRNLPRMIIVTKTDSPEADCEGVTDAIQEAFGSICLPINLPTPDGAGVVNVLEHDGSDDAGDDALFSSVHESHEKIVEQIIEVQDELMTTYLEEGEEGLKPGAVHDALEQALREAHLVPICYCSAKTGAGCKDLLHIFATLLPDPLEGNPRPFMLRAEEGGAEHEHHAEPDPSKPVIAHVFKVAADKHLGKLGVFRVHQGVVRAKMELHLDDQKKAVRVGHLVKRQGKDHVEVDALGPGDIGGVTKLDDIHFDGVLHEGHELDSLHLKPLPLPKPVFGLAIQLKNRADEGKFGTAIQKLLDEDPCLKLERIAATKQTVLRGLGEMHLNAVMERLKEISGIELDTSAPKIAYKETISKKGEASHRHKKQTGGAGQFGEVHLRVEPLPTDHETGFEFVNATVGGSIPRQFMPAIEKGIKQALADGAFAGYPLTGVRVEVFDGKHHPVDSKEIAFITAGRRAFTEAVKSAGPRLLEPYAKVEITAPASALGDLTGEIASKRGRVLDTEMIGSEQVIVRGEAPLGELQNLSTELRSLTGGAASYTLEHSHEEPCPPHVQQEVVAAFAPDHDED